MIDKVPPFRRAHYVYIAACVRGRVQTGPQRIALVDFLVAAFTAIPGFKPERFRQACNADITPTSTANKNTARKA